MKMAEPAGRGGLKRLNEDSSDGAPHVSIITQSLMNMKVNVVINICTYAGKRRGRRMNDRRCG